MASGIIFRLFTLLAFLLVVTTSASPDTHHREQRSPQDVGDAINSAIGGLASRLSDAGNSRTGQSTDASPSAPTGDSSSSTQESTSASFTTSDPSSSPTSSPTSRSSSSTPVSSSRPNNPSPSITDKPVTPTPVVVTVVRTSDGSTISSLSSSTPPASSATGSAELSQAASETSGMTAKTKTTVIGVVVGIGGAIILGGLFIVAWRIWGRGKKEDDSSDGLMGYRENSSHGAEKNGSGVGGGPSNPFQSTLESYHNPSKGVNASSNF